MTRDAASSTYAKQTRARIRSAFQLSLLLVAVTLLVYWRWGYGPWIKGLFIVSGFFAAVAALEFVASALPSKLKAKTNGAPPVKTIVPNDDFLLVDDPDGGRFERRLVVAGQPLVIHISAKLSAEKIERAKLLAATLLANPVETMKKFEQFKSREAERRPEYSDEIKRLKIDCIQLGSQVGEVYFTPESGGEPWSAAYENSDFSDLELGT